MSAMITPTITVNVELGERAYPIHIGAGLIGRTELFAPHIKGASVAIVTNSTIDPLYGDDVLVRIKAALNQSPETIALLDDALNKKEDVPSSKGSIAEWDGRGKLKLKLSDGSVVPAEISGSRTIISVAGKKSNRDNLKVGMNCTVDGPKGGEASAISCE